MAGRLVLGGRVRVVALAAGGLLCLTCARRGGEPPERLTLAVAMLPHAGLVHLALANGELARAGLEVSVERHDFGKLALDAVLAGRADVATCAETPVVFAELAGHRTAVIAEVSTAESNTVVLGRRAAGIAAARDLAGKRVGVPRGTNAEFFLDVLLVRHLVDRASVRVADLRPGEMAEALEAGRVDAVAIWGPVQQALRRALGDALVVLDAPDVYHETFDLVVRPALLRERPAVAARLLRALLEAEAFARARPAEARRRIAAALALAPADAEPLLAPFELGVWLDQGLVTLMEQEARWAVRAGLVPRQPTPNFLETVRAEPLLGVRPEAVRLLR